nr:efflux RND transporter periplasmic adaptor subunit [Roseomonas acroporae]
MPPPEVTVARPAQREVTDWDEFTGRFAAVERVELRARVSGYLDAVTFTDGQLVRRGDVLFRIDPRPFEAALAQAEGRVAEARSRLALAEREQARATALLRERAGSEAVAEQRTQGAEGARAQLATITAELQRARLDLEFATVRAPQDGRIGRHLVSPGNLVSGGEASGATLLAVIVTVDPIDISFDIDQAAALRYARLAAAGSRRSSREFANPVQLGLEDERDFPHAGRVVFVDNEADAGTGTIRLRARFDNPGGQLFVPGAFARLRLLGSAPYRALLLPDAAIATDQSRRVVYVLGPENRVSMREVRLGPLNDGLRVVRDGLRPEDEVVVRGMPRVRVGEAVAPRRLPPAAPLPDGRS